MNIASLTLKALMFKARTFENATKNPIESQKKVLFEYLRRNKETEYGRKYNFSNIRSISDYQKAVPLGDCESFHPYIEKMIKGELGILTVDKPIFFGITSGTTNKPKFIPVTEYSRAKKAETMGLWAYYIYRDHPAVLNGKILAIVNPEVEGTTESGAPYGAESGHGYRNLPAIVKHLYSLPYQVFNIKDYDARYYCILRIGMEHNVTTLATLIPSTIVLLCEKIKIWEGKIIEDIKKGTLSRDFNIPGDIRAVLEKTLKPNPERALELENILKEKKELLPKYFWPNMQLIECWKGGPVRLYMKELPQYFGDIPVRDFGYLSTETRNSIPMSDSGAGGVLAVTTNFYEFIPKEDAGNKEKRYLLCDQIEKGKEYFLIVTTPGGLYRYNIDDIITVDGFFNATPVIEFVQKGLNATSVTGEKLYESQVNEAVNKALEASKLLIEFFSASIEWGVPPRYIFLVELEGNPPHDKKKALLKYIEEGLCDQNAEYKDKRAQQVLGPPVLKMVKRGGFERYRAKKVKEGGHDSQFKVPELTSDMDFQKNFDIEEEIYMD